MITRASARHIKRIGFYKSEKESERPHLFFSQEIYLKTFTISRGSKKKDRKGGNKKNTKEPVLTMLRKRPVLREVCIERAAPVEIILKGNVKAG